VPSNVAVLVLEKKEKATKRRKSPAIPEPLSSYDGYDVVLEAEAIKGWKPVSLETHEIEARIAREERMLRIESQEPIDTSREEEEKYQRFIEWRERAMARLQRDEEAQRNRAKKKQSKKK
jgi:hypothetical protein